MQVPELLADKWKLINMMPSQNSKLIILSLSVNSILNPTSTLGVIVHRDQNET